MAKWTPETARAGLTQRGTRYLGAAVVLWMVGRPWGYNCEGLWIVIVCSIVSSGSDYLKVPQRLELLDRPAVTQDMEGCGLPILDKFEKKGNCLSINAHKMPLRRGFRRSVPRDPIT
ncbi:hypothetical protein SODALDRAFT_320349 [Sodiomyces alkalinus F11]|uniref:Uncharacterized protein n=1 Tax=Sodiomyces alkalinus (strain CBS 110278 / VKM F-3762 / F11) TaxID=1314773 RepID=A0A3N2PMW3_SODAK|nr:hypothetical protein SODALDRAFT_320349 [Sodiomyces alkalinus F11]ROT35855.1 hypothetical protein SODALDRAFT_320349 [Sodiomyces alkalinus F11]